MANRIGRLLKSGVPYEVLADPALLAKYGMGLASKETGVRGFPRVAGSLVLQGEDKS
jgi:hypothetical protein